MQTNNISISYAITTHNEGEYIFSLLNKLVKFIRPEDEIVVLDDMSDDPITLGILEEFSDRVKIEKKKFSGDFAEHKNYLNSLCKNGDIFNIDADEVPHDSLLNVIPEILQMNPTVDLFYVPRINVVHGITQEDITKWNWRSESLFGLQSVINFPDYQGRIYKNRPDIKWEGKVHERIVGHNNHSFLPSTEVDYCLLHAKNIERQRKQNDLYAGYN